MKKQLVILSALTVLNSPWAVAQNEEIDIRPLPPIQTNQDLRPSVDVVLETETTTSKNVIRVYKHIQHVDLRDVIKYDKEIKEKLEKIDGLVDEQENADSRLRNTSKKILTAVLENTERFIGRSDIKYFKDGAKGPSEKSSQVPYKERKRKPFVIGERYSETYTNTLFSVDYVSAREIAPSKIEADLLLFAQSTSTGPFFKKITVIVDWKKNKTHDIEDVVSVVKSGEDILLKDTDFTLKGSIADQKVILEDITNNIIKIFPVTVGAIDARDGIVESMNFHVPAANRNNARKAGKDPSLQAEFQDFSNAALVSRKVWNTGNHWANTNERIKPYDYKGRPFMALVDLNYVDGNNFAAGYREVGLHYQITSNRLERGFRSHGCVRIRDKDLYQVDAIVNQGPKNMIKAVFKRSLPNYTTLNHPHTYNKNVAMVKYTDYKSELKSENILCKVSPDKKRSVRWNSDDKIYHTVIGPDCLTSTIKETGVTSADVKAYWNGTGDRIKKFLVTEEHAPVKLARETLLKYNYRPATVDAMSHRQRLETIAEIRSGKFPTPKTNVGGNTDRKKKKKVKVKVKKKPISQKLIDYPTYGITANTIGSKRYKKARKKMHNQRLRRKMTDNEIRSYWVHIYYLNCIIAADPYKPANACPKIKSKIQKYLY